ncbi:unnamed protein product, partial [Prunus brigantina]
YEILPDGTLFLIIIEPQKDNILEVNDVSPSEAISILFRILENPSSSSEALQIKEQAITNLTDLLRQENRGEDLRNLLTQLRPFFNLIPEAKTAKIVGSIIDAVANVPGTSDLQISLCKEMWRPGLHLF